MILKIQLLIMECHKTRIVVSFHFNYLKKTLFVEVSRYISKHTEFKAVPAGSSVV